MRTLLPILWIAILLSCGQTSIQEEKMASPAGYDLNTPVKLTLSKELNEISGIRIDETNHQIVTLNDEEGKLYRLDMDGNILGKAFKFAKKGDFEELDFDGTYWYALKSNGEVHRISNAFTDSFTTRVFPFPETGIEFETICFDKSRKKTFLITKTPKELKDGRIPAYVLDTATASFQYEPLYSPDSATIATLRGKSKSKCKPTSAAFNPITGDLYVISVNDRILVIMNNGQVKQVFKLEKSVFRQPEGICFSANGDMFISNEAQDAVPNILKFRYTPGATSAQ